jgi:WD40 repeat protein
MQKSPFKFLDSYTKEDREIFFGREREIEELYHKVFESKIMLVYGVSGTGKSSLINCGLSNKFSETDWLPLNIRRGSNILESLASSIRTASITPQTGEIKSSSQFRKAIRSLYLDHYKPIYFIFDQFEELFIFGNKDEKKAVIQIIKSLEESEIQCRFIFVMREEYMAGITEFEKYIPTIFSNRVRIEKMSYGNAVETINGPCNYFGIEVEEGFAEALLEKLSPGSSDVELTYLQVFLDRILRLSTTITIPSGGPFSKGHESIQENRGGFSISLLTRVGNVSDLLGSFLEEQIKELKEPESGLTILKSFVSIKGTKKQLTEAEVRDSSRSLGKDIPDNTIREYLQKFVTLRILRDKDDNGRYELRHDSLATKIYEKITLVEKELLEVRTFIENEYENFKRRRVLLNDKDLSYISKYEKSLFLNTDLQDYIRRSRDISTSKVRVFRIITTVASIVFLLMVGGVVSYTLRNSTEVRSKNLALESLLMKNDFPATGWKLAMEAYKIKKTPIAVKALFESFYCLWNKKEFTDSLGNKFNPQKEVFDFTECKSSVISARFSDDGEYICGYLAENTVIIWNKRGSEVISIPDIRSQILSVKLSKNNKLVGALEKDSIIRIWDLEGKQKLAVKGYYNGINPNNVFNFSPDGKFISCITPDRKISVYNTSGQLLQSLTGHPGQLTCINYSPDSRFMVSSSIDSTVIVWYYNKNKSSFEEYTRLTGHKNAVWSVFFSKSSDYVLSASADSSIKLWSLNNKIVWDRNVASYYNTFKSYRARFCDATFYGNNQVIVFTQYRTVPKADSAISKGKQQDELVIYDQGVRMGSESIYFEGGSVLFYDHWLEMLKSEKTRKPIFSRIEFNDCTQYIAFTFSDDPENIYFSGTREIFKIMSFEGHLQQFSPNGAYLLASTGNKLKLYPADESELIELVEKKKIFGEMKTSWKYLENWYTFSQ